MGPAEQLDMRLAERIHKVTDGPVAVTRREVLAAQIKVAADKKLGHVTPDWIVRLVDVPLHDAKRLPPRTKPRVE